MSRWIVIAATVLAFSFVWFTPDSSRDSRASAAVADAAETPGVAEEARSFFRSISFTPSRKPDPDGISDAEAIDIAIARGTVLRQARAEGRELSELELASIGLDAPLVDAGEAEGIQVASIDAATDFSLLESTAEEQSTDVSAEPTPVWRVTGSNVNLRAGPGTGHSVITQAGLDDVVEPLTDPAESWVQVRLADTGETAWIFAKFLAREF